MRQIFVFLVFALGVIAFINAYETSKGVDSGVKLKSIEQMSEINSNNKY